MFLPKSGSVIDDQIELYRLCSAVVRLPQAESRDRSISIATLHGPVGRRSRLEPPPSTELGAVLSDFIAAIGERITSVAERWHVRQLVNIVSSERLEQILSRPTFAAGEDHDVRAIVEPGSLPMFSPLIVGNQHVFLALDDERLFRAKSAVYLHGREEARWAMAYFDELWNRTPWQLRDRVGPRDDEIAELQVALQALAGARERRDDRQRRLLIGGREDPPVGTPEAVAESSSTRLRQRLAAGESRDVEFKSSLRTAVPGGQLMRELESAVVKTVAGFLNSTHGGDLFIGVNDRGAPIGLATDYASSSSIGDRDGFERHLYQLLEARLRRVVAAQVRVWFPEIDGETICQVSCRPASDPVFDNDGEQSTFWLRVGSATKCLRLDEATRYIRLRWP